LPAHAGLGARGGAGRRPARDRSGRGRRASRESRSVPMILEIDNVGLAFGGVHALDGATFSVEEGQIVGVIGPNGAGKTTLFDCISGFQRPDAGRIVFDS